eukprot:c11660_g1_i1.p2 GENE.c11660_g1_i1~~c11660_g1_i1.p2  ORF type:complete len:100 (-),score=0.63 c11660_g1_i1:223-522(-)
MASLYAVSICKKSNPPKKERSMRDDKSNQAYIAETQLYLYKQTKIMVTPKIMATNTMALSNAEPSFSPDDLSGESSLETMYAPFVLAVLVELSLSKDLT